MEILEVLRYVLFSMLILGVLGLIIFTILLIVQYTTKMKIFSFINLETTPETVTQNLKSQVLAKTAPHPANTLLNFDTLNELNRQNFTLSFDCYLDGTNASTTVPRVLFYNISGLPSPAAPPPPIVIANSTTACNEYVGGLKNVPELMDASTTEILNTFPTSNFIVYVDSVKNDLRVGVITIGGVIPVRYLELLPPIENIPNRKPFQVAVIIGGTFVEVYIDKELVQTFHIGSAKFLTTISAGTEITTATTMPRTLDIGSLNKVYMYGPIRPTGITADTIKVGNIAYFDKPLTGDQIRNLTPTLSPLSFFT